MEATGAATEMEKGSKAAKTTNRAAKAMKTAIKNVGRVVKIA